MSQLVQRKQQDVDCFSRITCSRISKERMLRFQNDSEVHLTYVLCWRSFIGMVITMALTLM